MNFLAHLFLSCENEDLIVGNIIADFIRNKEVKNYSEAVQQGIGLHRLIDSYTDNHPIVRQGTKRLHPNHHKYAPVVIDIFYDHLLAHNWERYSDKTLEVFAKEVYDVLTKRMYDMPEKLQKRLPAMIQHNWLLGYKSKEGLNFVFEKMEERSSFASKFGEAVYDLEQDFELYNEEFNAFFPDIIREVKSYCAY